MNRSEDNANLWAVFIASGEPSQCFAVWLLFGGIDI